MEEIELKREQMRKKRNTGCACDCGGRYTIGNMYTHFKRDKHRNYIAKKEREAAEAAAAAAAADLFEQFW